MAKNIVVYTTWVVKKQVIEFIMIKITLKCENVYQTIREI